MKEYMPEVCAKSTLLGLQSLPLQGCKVYLPGLQKVNCNTCDIYVYPTMETNEWNSGGALVGKVVSKIKWDTFYLLPPFKQLYLKGRQ